MMTSDTNTGGWNGMAQAEAACRSRQSIRGEARSGGSGEDPQSLPLPLSEPDPEASASDDELFDLPFLPSLLCNKLSGIVIQYTFVIALFNN